MYCATAELRRRELSTADAAAAAAAAGAPTSPSVVIIGTPNLQSMTNATQLQLSRQRRLRRLFNPLWLHSTCSTVTLRAPHFHFRWILYWCYFSSERVIERRCHRDAKW